MGDLIMNLIKVEETSEWIVYNIEKDNKVIGSVEIIPQPKINNIYIENIVKDKDYKGKKLVKEVCIYLREKYKCDLSCLPLAQYRAYYESLGFKASLVHGEDIWYTLDINTQIP